MNTVDELIPVTLNEIDGVDQLANFNKGGLLAAAADTPNPSFGNARVKSYKANAGGLVTAKADWGVNSATYKAFAKMLQQKKRYADVLIMKRTAPVAEVQTLTASGAIQADETIIGVVNGIAVEVDYNTSSAVTLTALGSALSAIEGIASANVASLVTTVTATAEWTIPISLACDGATNPTTFSIAKTAGRTAADDIDEALNDPVLNDWYLLTAAQDNKGLNLVLIHHVETLGNRFFLAKTSEANIKSSQNTTNLGSRAAALGYKRSAIFLHQDMTEHIACAFAAYMGGVAPGKFQAQHKQLTGVTASSKSFLNSSEITTAQSRNVNTYRVIGSKALVQPGVRVDGKPLEMTRDLDYAANAYVQAIYAWLTSTDKVPYDDESRIKLLSLLGDTTGRLQTEGIARKDLPVTATVAEFADMDPADVTAGVFVAEVTFYYNRGASKVIFQINSVSGGAV